MICHNCDLTSLYCAHRRLSCLSCVSRRYQYFIVGTCTVHIHEEPQTSFSPYASCKTKLFMSQGICSIILDVNTDSMVSQQKSNALIKKTISCASAWTITQLSLEFHRCASTNSVFMLRPNIPLLNHGRPQHFMAFVSW
jgi:hypothetical protein